MTKFHELLRFLTKGELEIILKMGKQKKISMFSSSISVMETICSKHDEIIQREFDLDWIKEYCISLQDENQWRNIQGNLTNAFYHYIKLKKLPNSIDKDFELLDFFMANDLDTNYKRLLYHLEKTLNNQPINFHSDYYNFRLKEHKLILSEKTSTIKNLDNLNLWDRKLEQFYYINKLKIIIAKANRSHLNSNIQFEEREHFIINTIPKSFLTNTTIKTLIDCYKMFVENKIEYYEKLKEMVTTDKEMSFDFRSYVFSLLSNFIINQYNSGGEKIKIEYLNLIDTMENFNMLSQHGQVDRARIKNAATIAIRLNRLDWLEIFLNKTKNKAKNTNRETVLNYVDGLIHFHKESYNKSIKILEKTKPTEETLKVSKDILLIKLYFILNQEDAFYKKTDTLYRKMNNNKVLKKNVRRLRKGFIKFTVRVFKHRHNRRRLLDIKKEIQEYGYLPEASWIVSQIDKFLQ